MLATFVPRLALVTLVASAASASVHGDDRLFFKSPGVVGNTRHEIINALPIGNGRLGASMYGQPAREAVSLNADSVWSGPQEDRLSRTALGVLPDIRQALLDDDVMTAANLALGNLAGTPTVNREYQYVADVLFHTQGHEDYTNYERHLDLQNGTVRISYEVGGTRFTRQWFASYNSQAIICHLTASKPGRLSFDAKFNRTGLDDGDREGDLYRVGNDSIVLSASNLEGSPHYVARLKIESHPGSVTIGGGSEDIILQVTEATEATIFISIETDYWNKGSSPAELASLTSGIVSKASSKGIHKLAKEHRQDFRHFYDRTSLALDTTRINASKDITERYDAFKSGKDDLGLITLLFQFGRYLMISSSRAGSLPPNLVGIWANENSAVWGGKFTTNLNVEMNHWLTEVVGLSEMSNQLFQFTEDKVIPNGRKTAQIMYNCSGWVSHHNNDVWGDTAPHDNGTRWSFWPTGGAWPMTHLFEHYRFTGDVDFLKVRALPILTGIIEFFNDFLIERDGYLVTAPSLSPENSYITPNNITEAISIGPTSDNQILREIYNNFIDASAIVGSSYLVDEAKDVLSKIRAPVVDNYFGGVRQWWDDWEEAENEDGMMAPLLGLYPFDQINFWDSPPEWLSMAETSLRTYYAKSIKGCSWCTSWPVAFWARLRNGDEAAVVLKRLMTTLVSSSGGTWTINSDTYQIDGNLGVVAGIAELLLQSHGSNYPLYVLPALPSAWADGTAKGLGARGGFHVDIYWKDSRIEKVLVLSKLGNPLNVTMPSDLLASGEFQVQEIGTLSVKGNVKFNTEAGKKYTLVPT